MGFIKPGKNIKRSAKRKKPEATKDIAAKKPKVETTRQTQVARAFGLEDLPLEVIVKIFIHAGPHNNLPLVNTNLNRLLKYEYSDGYNQSLVFEVIKRNYVQDLNVRLDEASINQIYDYYLTKLSFLNERWMQLKSGDDSQLLHNKSIYKKILSDLAIIQYALNWFKLIEQSVVLSDEIFNNRFCNASLFDALHYNKIYNSNSDSPFTVLSISDIRFQRIARAKLFRFKFKEIALHMKKLEEAITSGEISDLEADSGTIEIKEDEIESFEENIEGSLSLPSYGDEREVKSFLIKDGDSLTFDFLSVLETKDLPSGFYRTGIFSIRKLELMLRFSSNHVVLNLNDMLQATLRWLEPSHINDLNFTKFSLNRVIKEIIASSVDSKLTESTLICVFKLYHYYESQDCGRFGLNLDNNSLMQDISKGVIQMLELFYKQFPVASSSTSSSRNDQQLWHSIVELRNFNLAQLLIKFNDCPNYDILRYLVN